MEQYRLSQNEQKQEQKASFFSRMYQSKRSNIKPVITELTPPIENPDCGVEYCLPTEKKPIQIWAKVTGNEHDFQVDISENLQRFNYDQESYPKESLNVQHIRFNPKINLIEKQMLINHDKLNKKKDEEEEEITNDAIEYRIELSEKSLKFLQINDDSLLKKRSVLKPTVNELEEDALEKKGIFLFSRRYQQNIL
jgi:hypothetical protein